MSASLICRSATLEDAHAISEIYNYYVDHTIITFEEESVSSKDIAQRLEQVFANSLPWLVAEIDGRVIGYAYAAPWRERSAYRHSVEVSVYLEQKIALRGVGSLLYSALFEALEASDVHVALAGIALPNDRSIALHEKFEMKKVAHLSQVGRKFDQWIDVGYWQRIL
ncbi:phosphinothricin acetyltransferase [Oleiphilus sp. HI0071]|jgi:phosphinothricin acetyltransferase|uniref:arsinothricin resistance N-acetyltransferase ArsN1 family B n=1 Tax=unclassified Oleiphilus TaxID=2631174 RepID=UPI0007C2AFC2|nr:MULTISPECIES: arsinothricin resistance N-acetyltransferase ArsN1 family B [unclassified Oleiphilus]KZY63700.1 phosphinothricin acetyltransferase [Oleiphilus sp. HI0065]KZY86524.1 phosphinothricin acetyltransferase [Oleiphilus sp. HI0071]KZY95528.1 phosphinothricin acetyltransferase [Oleiphilus sp. HI0073]KZZ51362.1 phosphinothricin acetyltransferase [Oleiphilus sp. HI0122]KZZ51566.1 phosphinothricin acetyltransferase [Oleiphilus sp. HI0118]KZZ76014.1 phosphinothricin acetyltransferase [Ole